MSTLEKTWLAVVRDTSWTMALLETSAAGTSVKAFQVFEMSFDNVAEFDVGVIKEWMAQHATGPSRLKIALDCAAVLTRFVELPRVSAKTLERHFKDNVASYFDCEHYEGMPDEYIINFKIAGFFQQHGHDRIRILLAALPKNLLTRVYRITSQLGIDLSSINIACECFMRLFEEMVPPEFLYSAFVDLSNVMGHVFLLEKGYIIRYANVKTDLSRLFQALERRDVPERPAPALKNQQPQPTGADTAERLFSFRPLGDKANTSKIFPEFAVVTPKIGEPSLEDLFVLAKDLPFALKITARDLQREREMAAGKTVSPKEFSIAQEGAMRAIAHEESPHGTAGQMPGSVGSATAEDDQTDFLFADAEQIAPLQQIYAQLEELIRDYKESCPPDEGENPFAKLYVTGIGTETGKIAALLKKFWQDILPVQIGFVEGWQPVLAHSECDIDDWTRHACLLGLILKTSDEMR